MISTNTVQACILYVGCVICLQIWTGKSRPHTIAWLFLTIIAFINWILTAAHV